MAQAGKNLIHRHPPRPDQCLAKAHDTSTRTRTAVANFFQLNATTVSCHKPAPELAPSGQKFCITLNGVNALIGFLLHEIQAIDCAKTTEGGLKNAGENPKDACEKSHSS